MEAKTYFKESAREQRHFLQALLYEEKKPEQADQNIVSKHGRGELVDAWLLRAESIYSGPDTPMEQMSSSSLAAA